MKRLTAMVGLSLLLAGCSGETVTSYDSVLQKANKLLSDTSVFMANINDTASLEKYRAQLNNSAARWEAYRQELQVLKARPTPQGSTQTTRMNEMQLRISRKSVLTQFARIRSLKDPVRELIKEYAPFYLSLDDRPPVETLPDQPAILQ